ncbi:nicotinate phosphoribosyltransferase [Gastrophryne carolinensis]
MASIERSGVPNFCAVALALHQLGYTAVGVRLDSGDLVRQSVEIRKVFKLCAARFNVAVFETLTIAVSNNISEKSVKILARRENEINVIGIGTHLVTCPLQPSLGCVYKLVQVNDRPRMKLSEDQGKTTIPGSKAVYRLYDGSDQPLLDLMALEEEPPPELGKEVKIYELGKNSHTQMVTPKRAELLHRVCFKNGRVPDTWPLPSIGEIRSYTQKSLGSLTPQQRCLEEPEPYRANSSIRRNCTDDATFLEQATITKNRFLEKGYEESKLDATLQQVKNPSTSPKPASKNYSQNNAPTFITNDYKKVEFIIKKHWEVLTTDPTLKDLVGPKPSIYNWNFECITKDEVFFIERLTSEFSTNHSSFPQRTYKFHLNSRAQE